MSQPFVRPHRGAGSTATCIPIALVAIRPEELSAGVIHHAIGWDGVKHTASRTGSTYTCRFEVPERSGPGPMDGSSILWMYHSHTNELRDVNTGLIGPIVLTRRGGAKPDGSAVDVDREVYALFSQMDENASRLLAQNLADKTVNPRRIKPNAPDFDFANSIFTINGYAFGNLPMIDVHVGQRTRWYVMSTMSDFDFHAPHWHGETVVINGMRTDTAQLGPMGMLVADMIPDNPGVWLYHCHLDIHMQKGMIARFRTIP